MTSYPFFSKNGQILPMEEATVPLFSIEYCYGFGVYETLRVKNDIPYFLIAHSERLIRSAKIIELEHSFDTDDVARDIRALVRALKSDQPYNIKILLVGGKTAEEADLYLMPFAPLFIDRALYRDGAPVISVAYERLFPQAKTLNMLGSYLAYRKAKRGASYDALLLDRSGFALEGTRSNLFMMHGRTVISPPTDRILEGVTRKTVRLLLEKHHFSYEERCMTLSDIVSCDGAFLTSTGAGIMPIRAIDEYALPPIQEAMKELMAYYDEWKETCGGVIN